MNSLESIHQAVEEGFLPPSAIVVAQEFEQNPTITLNTDNLEEGLIEKFGISQTDAEILADYFTKNGFIRQ